MKHFSVLSLCVVLFTAITLCGNQLPASAQTTTRTPLVTQTIKMHNVRPSIMAYWIDPERQPVPPEYQNALSRSNYSKDQINQYIPQIEVFEKSFHGQIFAAIDANNTLMIMDSQDDVDQDIKLIKTMDKPLVQVEVAGVTLSADQKLLNTIPTFPLNLLNAEPNDPAYSIALMTAEGDALVKQLRSSGKLKVVDSPRVVTFDHLPASIGRSSTTPIELEIKQTPGLYLPFKFIGAQQIGLGTSSTMETIPTINADGTITISLTLSYDASLVPFPARFSKNPHSKVPPYSKEQQGSIFIKSLNNGPLTFNFTVKDNQSVLIRGIDSLYKLGDYHPSPEIFILTVHIRH